MSIFPQSGSEPVLSLQTGYGPELRDVVGDHREVTGHSDRSDQQIPLADGMAATFEIEPETGIGLGRRPVEG